MSNSSLNLAADDPATAQAAGSAASAATPSNPGRSNMGVPYLFVLLVVGAGGLGVFGMTEFQGATSARSELGELQSQVVTLTTTATTLQVENDHYKSLLTRVRAATGSLQASLAELDTLAGSPAPSAPPATAAQ